MHYHGYHGFWFRLLEDGLPDQEIAQLIRLDGSLVEGINRIEGHSETPILTLYQLVLLYVQFDEEIDFSLHHTHQSVLHIVRYFSYLHGGALCDYSPQAQVIGGQHKLHEVRVAETSITP